VDVRNTRACLLLFLVPAMSAQSGAAPYQGGDEPAPGATKLSVKGNLPLIYVPSGDFTMGSEKPTVLNGDGPERIYNEGPEHLVFLDGYWIGQDVVTIGEYRTYCKATGLPFKQPAGAKSDSQPMVDVSWDEARAFCRWAGGDLPSEAQWEKAARGPDAREYPWGDIFSFTLVRNRPTSVPNVAEAGASPYGCYDMAGDVSQWCLDTYAWNYRDLPRHNPISESGSALHVTRGCPSLSNLSDQYRCAARSGLDGAARMDGVGFRVVGG